ncbi:MAG: GHKL domain-containing protein [Bacteroidetes bacterium]|nr:GHKL domain-containing protein [Bacteroidota bacterium]MBK8413548.1 GHKL domain-containing protein [Bacteroidota bacterium]
MENLINGILDYSKAAKRNDQFELFDTGTIVKEAVEFLGHKSEVNFQVQDKLPMVLADKVKVQQVFMNLIGNAIKFNTKADKQVKITFTETGPFYQFSIKDNGPGIDPRFHDKIFVIFQTINTRDEFESTGVGLAIVKKIIEEQGGRIWVESHAGNGATFHFTWPKYHENAQIKSEQYAKAI